jgi:hypothetical protein
MGRIVPLLALAVATTAGACAPRVFGAWAKPAMDPREQRRDEYECAREATFAAPADAERAAAFARCMRARGYQPVRDR